MEALAVGMPQAGRRQPLQADRLFTEEAPEGEAREVQRGPLFRQVEPGVNPDRIQMGVAVQPEADHLLEPQDRPLLLLLLLLDMVAAGAASTTQERAEAAASADSRLVAAEAEARALQPADQERWAALDNAS